MKELKLTNSIKVALVDDEDYHLCVQIGWSKRLDDSVRSTSRKIPASLSLASYIMNDYDNVYDHKDRNKLNNQKHNLRLADRSQNGANKDKYVKLNETTSKYKGASWSKSNKHWMARIRVNGMLIYLGQFSNEKDAALAYDKAATEYFGEFAKLNFQSKV